MEEDIEYATQTPEERKRTKYILIFCVVLITFFTYLILNKTFYFSKTSSIILSPFGIVFIYLLTLVISIIQTKTKFYI